MKRLKYSAIIRPLSKEEGGGYLIEIPELPGCRADAETVEEAFVEAESAIESGIQTAKEFGDPIPDPSISNSYRDDCKSPFGAKIRAFAEVRSTQNVAPPGL